MRFVVYFREFAFDYARPHSPCERTSISMLNKKQLIQNKQKMETIIKDTITCGQKDLIKKWMSGVFKTSHRKHRKHRNQAGWFSKKTKKTLLSVCRCFQPLCDASHIFFLVCEHPDKNQWLTSWPLYRVLTYSQEKNIKNRYVWHYTAPTGLNNIG